VKSANDIRRAYLEFFARHDHKVVPSAPLVPHNDPTLMFTNAGMVPFKNVFTGTEPRGYVRATSSQKCVRAGGKHNDLDNVGHTARHHTFFEMLGNFSFGDYFKEDAIELAWSLLTKEFDIDPARLVVTVYHTDDQAAQLWKKIAGLSDDKIIRIPTADNFWSMGDIGPCGPCSEIFYDHGEQIQGGLPGTPEEDGDRFVEIWNLVFMQHEQMANGERVDLPHPSIDTGMGLERVTAVMQGVHDNYDTDLFRSLIEASAEESGVEPDGEHKVSHRVIADHLRSASFLIADGVLPSNEGRGYVLRRIMRRAMRHVHLIGEQDPLMWRLVPALIAKMGQAYGELNRAEALITETLKLEESRFHETLNRGLRLLDGELEKLPAGSDLPGDVAFKLYDTYGFPIDLTQDAMRAHNLGVDIVGFEAAMDKQRADARAAWSGSGETATDDMWYGIREEHGVTEFMGYELGSADGTIVSIIKDGESVEQAGAGDSVSVLTNQTPFYGESGGQMGDTGTMQGADMAANVSDARKYLGDMIAHVTQIESGSLKVGDIVDLQTDSVRRSNLRANHSATHLMHAAMRHTLGDHVTQKGSLVAPDRLRFDVSHQNPLTPDEIIAIENDVNDEIRANIAVETHLMTPDEAIEAGALALFGEKYGDEVRVVRMGTASSTASKDETFSVELCGGTHVARTGDIGLFKIVSQSAVSAGVRRIEALTGAAAQQHVATAEQILASASATLKTTPTDLVERLEHLVTERKSLERQLAEAKKAIAMGGTSDGPQDDVADVDGVAFTSRHLDGVSAKDLRGLIDAAKKKMGSGVAAFVTVADGKAALAVGVTEDLTERLNAVDLVRAGAVAIGGKGGGGRPDMAQAGGPDGDNAAAALAAIEKAIRDTA
jgi:alanyl-tRNA synthetase